MTFPAQGVRATEEPSSVNEFAQCVASLYAHDLPFAFEGGGTQLALGNPPRALNTVVKTTGCNRLLDYSPQDQTITVEAGMTLAAIAEILARERQFVALDSLEPQRTTVGGAIATNLFGRRRLRYGSLKDSIVGVEMVRPDGTRARGGGKVVKNVAGFDVPKLLVGSLGTLGAIVSATFRVFPMEEKRAIVTCYGVTLEQMMRLCDESLVAALVPSAVVACNAALTGRVDTHLVFEGSHFGVEAQTKTAMSIAFRLGLRAGAIALPFEEMLNERERAVRTQAPWRVQFTARPTELARFFRAHQVADEMQVVIYPQLGVAFGAADELTAAAIARWRAALEKGSVIVHAMPETARATVETWGAPRASSLAIMQRLKANFDPKGLCNAGRFIGGI